MQFIITAYDGKDMLEKRLEVRQHHLDNIGKINGKVICAGGMLDENGKMKGSVLIMDFACREDLDVYLKNEPYVTEHVWDRIEVEPMNVVIINGEKIGK